MTVAVHSSMSSSNHTSQLGGSQYPYSIARSHQQDLTPYSAVRPDNHFLSLRDFLPTESDYPTQVSSFNLPARADTNLYTPVSMTSSPQLPIKTNASMHDNSNSQIKLSPSMSPTYMFDEEEFGPRYNTTSSSMKAKAAYASLDASTYGSLAPDSPTYCGGSPPSPYFGMFGVSGTAKSAPTPPSEHASPRTQHPMSTNTISLPSYRQLSAHSNSAAHTPKLIAPSPHGLRPAMSSYPYNSLTSNESPPSYPRFYSHRQRKSSSPGSRKSQKKALEPSYNDYLLVVTTPELRAEINDREMLVCSLRYKSPHELLDWKAVAKEYSQRPGYKKTRLEALQMCRTRMMQRLSARACEIAAISPDILKWEGICKQLNRYKVKPKKREDEGHPEHRRWEVNSFYGPQYDMHSMRRARTASDLTVESFDTDSWRNSREGTTQSHESDAALLSALSHASMEDPSRRSNLEAANNRFEQHRQQAPQHQQYQQQHTWGQGQNS